MEKTTDNSSFNLRENSDIGSVKIANDVIGMIAALAAMEIDGVSGMPGNITSESLQKSGKKLTKGVRVQLSGKNVVVDLALLMGYGFNIPATSQKVQTRVKSTVENMTGLNVTDVNVHISGITVAEA
ncbi:Asp23/Gls24 family envelope stress response protein [Butyrivibrio fibrisolvens]|uniref:Asp23/Gls24 family envelope stress response protein n=1 Tax=Butyrivibrio fibrisolvens TaxID=831 RepID=A0A317G1Y0_BUTFI|nr:Asp23/Gls24 family envelope stress response protein [Butyrivibrio fibrisolvens]PWT27507.1 Asp23/Gls24 family envelope stress response protein [Butyrivibrio fibrisolvens]